MLRAVLCISVAAGFLTSHSNLAAARAPNVLLIITDDND